MSFAELAAARRTHKAFGPEPVARETLIELFAEVIVHFLQIIHGNRDLGTRMAIALLAAADEDLDVLIVVRRIVDARHDIAG